MKSHQRSHTRRALVAAAASLLFASCGSDDKSDTAQTTAASTAGTAGTVATTIADSTVTTEAAVTTVASGTDCDTVLATFRAVESANPDLVAPSLVVTCDGDYIVVQTNSMPDYLYIEASPGDPEPQDLTFRIPLVPVVAATPGQIPYGGSSAVAINGVAIYGPTEATGGDVLSLPSGALSACGSHNGPTGFHIHLFLWADGVDCLYDAALVESNSAGQVGWSLDGYPIMSGFTCVDAACSEVRQLVSSWQLTDDSLFASDTWSAHSYVEGSGDLDQCNGRVDADGQYRYYTTPTFPYFMGCYHGEVAADAGGGTGGMGGPP